MQKLLKWWDEHIITILAGFLLIFIPLYPKLPLLDALPGYIVRVRLEDFFVSLTIVIWFIQLIRGKIHLLSNPLFKPVMSYLAVGLLSMLSAMFLIHTTPLQWLHIDKLLLHYLRRIEYFSLFFIFYSGVRSLKVVKVYLSVFIVTIIAVVVYGFGQKYLYWPAFSTMNREFSKGWMLYLTEHARVLSTFGGHYDLAAFIMMALIMLWSIFFGVKKIIWKLLILFVLAGSFWTLILTASRTSFLAYLFGLMLMFFFYAFKKGIRWSITRWFTVSVLSVLVMLSFGDLSERFTKLLRIDERIIGIKSLLLSPIGAPPSDKAVFLENNPNAALADITSKSDQPPTPLRPSDVFQDIPLSSTMSASASANQRTYSKTAFQYDLSTAIRLDALWPMAIKGFVRNPLLGSGYANLNKTQPTQFTEAESTDNDFLRSLGETGLLGFLTFYGTLFFLVFIIWRNLSVLDEPLLFAAVVGFLGLVFGLLLNALYIDVFESSKVAFSFWALAGMVAATVKTVTKDRKKPAPYPHIPDLELFIQHSWGFMKRLVKRDLFYVFLIVLIASAARLYRIKEPLADWHSWRQADTSAVTRNFVRHGINVLYPVYDDLSNIASGKDNPRGLRMVEFPLYNILSVITDKLVVGYTVEISGRLTSIFASLGSLIFIFLIVRKYRSRLEAFLAAIVFALIPYNIFYSRVILPEPLLVCLTTGMIYFWDRWIDRLESINSVDHTNKEIILTVVQFIGSFLFTVTALLVKPTATFLFLPMVYLWIRKFGFRLKSLVILVMYFLLCFLPLLWWRLWENHFPEGIPAFSWLLNGDGIRFKGAFFQWLFAERLSKLILGYFGLPLMIFGFLAKKRKEGWLFIWWGISILLYVTIVATGNIRHDYYQTITIPIIAIFIARGISYLFESKQPFSTVMTRGTLSAVLLIGSWMFGWYQIRDYYNINHPEIIEAGSAVERKTPEKALVIAPYNGDTAFLYQTHRAGWPIMQDTVDKMIKKGADFYVSVNFDDLTKQLYSEATAEDPKKRKYKLIEKTDKYVIIQLVPDKQLPK